MSLFLQYGAADVAPKGIQLGYAHSHPGKTGFGSAFLVYIFPWSYPAVKLHQLLADYSTSTVPWDIDCSKN